VSSDWLRAVIMPGLLLLGGFKQSGQQNSCAMWQCVRCVISNLEL